MLFMFFQPTQEFINYILKILSVKTKLLRSVDVRRMRTGEYQENPFWDPRKRLRPFLALSDVLSYLHFFVPLPLLKTIMNSFSSIPFMVDRFGLAANLILWSGID